MSACRAALPPLTRAPITCGAFRRDLARTRASATNLIPSSVNAQLVAANDGQGDGFVSHYDPRIALPFKSVTPEIAAAGEAVLWQRYDSLSGPTLLIRGGDSDLLSHATAQAMTERGPRARLVELPGIGHAPTLVAPDQVALVREFLAAS